MIGSTPLLAPRRLAAAAAVLVSRYFVRRRFLENAREGRKKRRTRTMMPQKMHLTRAKFTQIRRRPLRTRTRTRTQPTLATENRYVFLFSLSRNGMDMHGDHRNRRLQSFMHEAWSFGPRRTHPPPSARALATICRESYFSFLRSKVSLTLEQEVSTQFVRRPLAPEGARPRPWPPSPSLP